jgi:tRNA pseudouridine38-40 synthase
VLWSQPVAPDFHARYAARSRTYRYLLLNRPVRPALAARYAGWHHAPLDLEAMRQGASQLLGQHDFSAFRAAECQAKSPVRTLHEIDIEREGECIAFRMRANAWLQHMVRNIVGTLVYVGKGKHPPQWPKKLLESRDRALAAPTFGPEGLYLDAVEYQSHWGIPASENGKMALPVDL